MSAGTSCKVKGILNLFPHQLYIKISFLSFAFFDSLSTPVVFIPRLNEDIDDVIPLLAETGPISIPLICETKKCKVGVNHSVLDFGRITLGESKTQTLKITNDGAIDTNYQLISGEWTISNNNNSNNSSPIAILTIGNRNGNGEVLKGYSSDTIDITVKPNCIGAIQQTIAIKFTAKNTPDINVQIQVRFINQPKRSIFINRFSSLYF